MSKFVWRKGRRVPRNPTPYPLGHCDAPVEQWPHDSHDHMAINGTEGQETYEPYWCDGQPQPAPKVKSTPIYAADTETIPAVRDDDGPKHMTRGDVARIYEVPAELLGAPHPFRDPYNNPLAHTRQSAPDAAQAPLPPTQGPDGPENAAAGESDGSTGPQWEASVPGEPVGGPRNPIRIKGSPNQLAVDCTDDGIHYIPWDMQAASVGDRHRDYTMLRGEFHPSIQKAIEEVRRDQADNLGRDILNDAGLLKPSAVVNHGGGPGVPTVNTPMALHFAGTVQSGDLIVIKDEHGHDLLSLRVKNGRVQARYYEGDIDNAAEHFFDFLMDFVPPEPPPHDWQEYNASGNTCHYRGCRKSQVQH